MIREFNEFLVEGLYDPGIFKAFFLAGGPGSGKSFVSGGVGSLYLSFQFFGGFLPLDL